MNREKILNRGKLEAALYNNEDDEPSYDADFYNGWKACLDYVIKNVSTEEFDKLI